MQIENQAIPGSFEFVIFRGRFCSRPKTKMNRATQTEMSEALTLQMKCLP